MESANKGRLRSKIWQFFTKKADFMATCNRCHKDYSYRGTSGNLTQHWLKKHGNDSLDDSTDCSDEEWSDQENSNDNKTNVALELSKQKNESKSTWEYYDVLDSDKFVARCKECDRDVEYDSVSDLKEHLKEHVVDVSDDEQNITGENSERHKKGDYRSFIWKYMKVVDKATRSAVCLVCRSKLKYSTVTNLKSHMRKMHPEIKLPLPVPNTPDNETKKILISANGQLYEVETSDGEKDPIPTDAVYLEDTGTEDIFEPYQSKTPPKKKHKTIGKKTKRNIFTKDMFQNVDTNNSDEEYVPVRSTNIPKQSTTTSTKMENTTNTRMESLDFFGQYVISLLKEMPQNVSDQLQVDFIKQIFAARVVLESPCAVTSNTKPVTVIINNNTDMPEITVSDVTSLQNIKMDNS